MSRDGGKGDKQRPLSVPKEQFENNWDSIFNAQPKREGEPVTFDKEYEKSSGAFDIGDLNLDFYPVMKRLAESIDYTYVERRVPEELEDEAHELIDNWLKSKGYDPEEI